MHRNDSNRKRTLVAASVFSLALIAGGCGVAENAGGTVPANRALLTADGDPVVVCQNGCVFEGRGMNQGIGCAANVRGTTRLQMDRGQLGEPVPWELDSGWVVRPGETFLYDGCCLDQEQVDRIPKAVTEIQWDDVECR